MLDNKIRNKTAIIGIIGIGHVGLNLAIEIVRKGFDVIGFDLDKEKIDKINSGKSYLSKICSKEIEKFVRKRNLKATKDFSQVSLLDVIIICTPTYYDKKPDISSVLDVIDKISKYIKKDTLVIIESTLFPEAMKNQIIPAFEKNDLNPDKDFYLVYSPERIDYENKDFPISKIPKLVSGCSKKSIGYAKLFYGKITKTIPVPMEVAEVSKLLENTYRFINIAFVNELKIALDKIGIDIYECIKATETKPFGFHAFYPKLGAGGHCVPSNSLFLLQSVKKKKQKIDFIELADKINKKILVHTVNEINRILKENKKNIKNSKLLVLGITYKRDVDDISESQSLKLIDLLIRKGAFVEYNDPYFPSIKHRGVEKQSIQLTKKNLKKFDCVIIAVDHKDYNYDFISKNSKLVYDACGLKYEK